MTTFYMILLILLVVFLLCVIVWIWSEKEYWANKYMEAVEEMYPIQWDFVREDGEVHEK